MVEVKLRAMEPEDLDLLYKIENNTQLWNVSTTNVPYSRYVLHDYIANSSGDIYTDKQVRLMIDDGLGRTIGIVDVVNFSPQHRRAELGIVIQAQYRGQGYGKAAVLKVLDYTVRVLHLHQLYVVVNASQQSTIDLFVQTGFVRECKLRDWLYDGTAYSDAIVLQYILVEQE